jgi:outer membrane receptor protein involved in Fe transport
VREFGNSNGNLAGRTTNPGASNEGWYKWKGDSSLDWNWNHFDIIGTVHYIDGFHEFKPNLTTPHWVHQTWFVDVQGSYDFTGLIPVEQKPVPGYSKDSKTLARDKDGSVAESATSQTLNSGVPAWQKLLFDGTTLSIGCNNVFGQDPPKAFGEGGNGVGYPGFTYDATGRFVYARLTKKF